MSGLLIDPNKAIQTFDKFNYEGKRLKRILRLLRLSS